MAEVLTEEIDKLTNAKEGQFFDVAFQEHREIHSKETISASKFGNGAVFGEVKEKEQQEVDDGYRGKNSDKKVTLIDDKTASKTGIV